jgi:hypothetical protein
VAVALLALRHLAAPHHGDGSVLNRRISTAAKPVEIIGVPRDFISPGWAATDPAWDGLLPSVSTQILAPLGRLRPGQ